MRKLLCGLSLLLACGCGMSSTVSQTAQQTGGQRQQQESSQGQRERRTPVPAVVRSSGSPVLDKLVEAAIERTNHRVRYDATYFVIEYPNGDVPAEVGVCTDEVIRSYRQIGVDLQREVHEDMRRNFELYPRKWGLSKPDTNIDHRRVPNLITFFTRRGASLPITENARDYAPGDIVTWDLSDSLTHIGIVVGIASAADPERLLIVHNIGAGPQMEDVLFNWKITGHFRYEGTKRSRQ